MEEDATQAPVEVEEKPCPDKLSHLEGLSVEDGHLVLRLLADGEDDKGTRYSVMTKQEALDLAWAITAFARTMK